MAVIHTGHLLHTNYKHYCNSQTVWFELHTAHFKKVLWYTNMLQLIVMYYMSKLIVS
jgi:hypothetical protein